MKSPLSPRIELEFFRQLWQKSDDPFWLCACAGEDFVLTAVNPAEEAISRSWRDRASASCGSWRPGRICSSGVTIAA